MKMKHESCKNSLAIEVKKAFKYYGAFKHKKIVLNKLDLKIEYGTIYGLLGASGCGKTTLVSSILGLTSLNSGQITVLQNDNTIGNDALAKRIGYMPQETALVNKLTIKENVYYFGNLYGMDVNSISDRYTFLSQLLEFPSDHLSLEQCSGGEQRRVSLAIAIVHSPELLLLDEPTVGLDSLIRKKIWDFLIEEVLTKQITVIITTHYIEEARQASRVGFMYDGALLIEDSPETLITNLNVSSLEDAFVILRTDSTIRHSNMVENFNCNLPDDHEVIDENHNQILSNKFQCSKKRIKTIFIKNLKQLLRQPGYLFAHFFLSGICFWLVFLALGLDPKGLEIGIVNNEVPNSEDCYNQTLVKINQVEDGCEWSRISCIFLNEITEDELHKIYFSNIEEAMSTAIAGHIIGAIEIDKHFSVGLHDLFVNGTNASNQSLDSKEINIFLDQTDKQKEHYVKRVLIQSFEKFAKNLMTECNYSVNLLSAPLSLKKPIFGSFDEKFTSFLSPGVLITWTYFFCMIFSLDAITCDRYNGVWNRILVTGSKPSEFLIAHLLIQQIMMIFQCFCTLFVMFVIYQMPNNGSYLLIFCIILIMSLLGVWVGLVFSIYFNTYSATTVLSVNSFYLMLFLSGILWPLEGAHISLQKIGNILPFSKPAIAVRHIMTRGYSISEPSVYICFVTVISWILVMMFLCFLRLRKL